MGKKSKAIAKINLEQVEMMIDEGKFREAARVLQKAKGSSQEQKKINQLKINTHFFWALAYFKEQNYLQAISTLRMFTERHKKKIALPIEKANVLLGISYLYTNTWNKAIDYLKNTKDNPTTVSFYFYYLLALIFKKEHTNFEAFLLENESAISNLEEDRKQYLRIAFVLVQEDYKGAMKLLETFQPKEEQAILNAKALLAQLSNTTFEDNKAVKTLYSFLLQLPLNAQEKIYLDTLPELKSLNQDRKYSEIRTDLKVPLEKLCEAGKPLTSAEFETCMGMPENYRPYIVYNQIAALYNEDLEEEEETILAILKKYEWYFLQVPEAPFLFNQIVYWDSDNFTATHYLRVLETSLDKFGKSYSPLQLSRLSWRIFSCMYHSDYYKEKTHVRQFHSMLIKFPYMLGLKMYLLIDTMTSIKSKKEVPNYILDLFTYGHLQHGASYALEEFESGVNASVIVKIGMEEILDEFRGLIPDYELRKIEQKGIEESQDIFYNTLDLLIKTTTEFEVHLKNRMALDCFKIVSRFYGKEKNKLMLTLSKEQHEQFAAAYHQLLVLFEENTDSSIYNIDYQLWIKNR